MNLKKYLANHLVAITLVLPNIAINGATQAILDIGFHWTGWLSILAWLIGGGLSLEYGIVFAMFTKTNFKVLGREWKYSD